MNDVRAGHMLWLFENPSLGGYLYTYVYTNVVRDIPVGLLQAFTFSS